MFAIPALSFGYATDHRTVFSCTSCFRTMDKPNTSHSGSLQAGTEDFTGHWQPALRPDALASSQNHSSFRVPVADAEPPLLPTPKDDVPDQQKTDTVVPPSVSALHPQSLPPNAASESIGEQNPYLRQSGEQHVTAHGLDGSEKGAATAWGNTQDSLKSPVVGLSWSTDRNVFEDNDAEISSDEDNERLDPAWGITRMDSTQVLQKVNRSSSFPDFESHTISSNYPPTAQLSYSQVEQIMQEEEEADSREESLGCENIYGATNGPESRAQAESLPAEVDVEQYPSGEPENSQTRFEEGLPLIPQESDMDTFPKEKIVAGNPL